MFIRFGGVIISPAGGDRMYSEIKFSIGGKEAEQSSKCAGVRRNGSIIVAKRQVHNKYF